MQGSATLDHFVSVCRRGDFEEAERLLLWAQCSRPPYLAAVTLADWRQNATWLKLERCCEPDEGEALLNLALAGLASLGTRLLYTVGTDPLEPGTNVVSVALDSAESADWLQDQLAPMFVFSRGEPPIAPQLETRSIRFGRLRSDADPRDSTGHADSTSLTGRLLRSVPEGALAGLLLEPLSTAQRDTLRSQLAAAAVVVEKALSTNQQVDEVTSLQGADPAAERLAELLSQMIRDMDVGHASGCWHVEGFVAVDNPHYEGTIAASFADRARPGQTPWSVTAVPRDRSWEDSNLDRFTAIPTGAVAALVRPPANAVGSLVVGKSLPRHGAMPRRGRPVDIGKLLGSTRAASIDIGDLSGNAFVCGTTGSGKSSSIRRILLALWNAHNIPFLVLDPVKADYETLAPLIRDGLHVVRAADICMNVLEPWPGTTRAVHFGHLGNAMRGSFALPSPTPYVLSQVLERALDVVNRIGSITLHDLKAILGALIPELGYAGEIESNIRASLEVRLDLLLTPNKAHRFASASNAAISQILDRPTVVDLGSISDDQERAFATTMLATYVAEAARARVAPAEVTHVTVLEEAHRILPEAGPGGADSENVDPTVQTAKQLAAMLAEIRSFGEAVVVIDQSPSAVSREVIRNTILKIVHRIVDPADQTVAGESIGLDEDATSALGTLPAGAAVMSSRSMVLPRGVMFAAPAEMDAASLEYQTPRSDYPCCAGAAQLGHHKAEAHGAEAEAAMHIAILEAIASPEDPDLQQRIHAHIQRASDAVDAPLACVVRVGLRRALLAYHHERVLRSYDSSHIDVLLDGGLDVDGFTAMALVARKGLNQRLEVRAPFAGCSSCPDPCGARVASRVVGGPLAQRLSSVLSRSVTGGESKAVHQWREQTARYLTLTTRSPVVGATIAHCAAARAADQVGVDLT